MQNITIEANSSQKLPLNLLQLCSLLYLGVPILLFYISWLKWYYAFLFIFILVIPLLNFRYNVKLIWKRKYLIFFVTFFLFLLLLGFGEVFNQSSDWIKHNAIFSELFYNWNSPILIDYFNKDYFLCYGLGFYILPSWLAGFLNSYFILRWLILINSVVGIFLIGLWLNHLYKIPLFGVILIFLCGVNDFLKDFLWLLNNTKNGMDIFYTFFSIPFLVSFDFCPQHGIPTILLFSILLKEILSYQSNYLYSFFMVVIGLFWSPFIVFALIPFLFFIKPHLMINRYLIINSIPIIFTSFFIIIYYGSHYHLTSATFEFGGLRETLSNSLFNYSLQFFFIFLINWKINFLKSIEIKLILTFLFVSIIFKKIHFGYHDDFAFKTTYLMTFILNIFLVKGIVLGWYCVSKTVKTILVLFIILSSFTSLKIFYNRVLTPKTIVSKRYINTSSFLSSNEKIKLKDALMAETEMLDYPFVIQYIGKPNLIINELMKNKN